MVEAFVIGKTLKQEEWPDWVTAFEFWESAQNCVVDGCKIGQIFDSGVTPQAQGTASNSI
jgi:hypothetical protein